MGPRPAGHNDDVHAVWTIIIIIVLQIIHTHLFYLRADPHNEKHIRELVRSAWSVTLAHLTASGTTVNRDVHIVPRTVSQKEP